MAGPSIGTWVKVRNKSGRMTARVIAKAWGATPEKGTVITQSQYEQAKQKGRDVNETTKAMPKRFADRMKQIDDEMNNALKDIPARFTKKRQKAKDFYQRKRDALERGRKSALEQIRLNRNEVKGILGMSRDQMEGRE